MTNLAKTFRIFMVALLVAQASPAFAVHGSPSTPEYTTEQMSRDYNSVIFFLTLPPEVRAEAGRRIAMVGAAGLLGLIGANYISSKVMAGFQRKLFTTVLKVGISMGAIIFIDGFFAYMTNGKVVPISMALDELISIVKPASAATLGDYFLENDANFREFLTIGPQHGAEIMSMNPELALTIRAYAQACRAVNSGC